MLSLLFQATRISICFRNLEMSESDRLVAIPKAEWPQLRDSYRPDWPQHFTGYQTIDTFIRLTDQRPGWEMEIFSLNGDWSDGLFVAKVCFDLFLI